MTTLSASSVSTYLECHLQWYFEHVEARPQPSSEPRETGIEVHDYAEAILKAGGPVLKGGPCDVCEMVPHSPQCPNTSVADPLVGVFLDDILPTYGEPALIEAAFELDVEGVTYTGFIDSVDLREPTPDDPNMTPGKLAQGVGPNVVERQAQALFGQTVLRDLKTVKSRPSKRRFRRALTGYHLGARELGHEPDRWLLDYIVRTKVPYYWPEEQEPASEDEIDIWVGEVLTVHQQIEMADWEPTGLGSYACAYCPYKDICGPYERYQDMTSPIREEAR